MRPLRFCLLVWLLGLLAGCSSPAEDAPPDGDAGAAGFDEVAVRTDLAAAFAGDRPGPRSTGQGRCFADTLLSSTTPAELREGGLLDEDLTVVAPFPPLARPLAEDVVDAQLACSDVVAASSSAGSYVTKGELDQQRYAGCLRRAVPDPALREALVAAVMGAWDAPELLALSRAQVRCTERARS